MVQRAAIYARVSTDDQSCDRQVAELQQYAVCTAKFRPPILESRGHCFH